METLQLGSDPSLLLRDEAPVVVGRVPWWRRRLRIAGVVALVVAVAVSIAFSGLIYLQARDAEKAVAEFQRILDHRSANTPSPVYPLAYVQQARAYALIGDQTKARKAYQDFLTLWKDADADIPFCGRRDGIRASDRSIGHRPATLKRQGAIRLLCSAAAR